MAEARKRSTSTRAGSSRKRSRPAKSKSTRPKSTSASGSSKRSSRPSGSNGSAPNGIDAVRSTVEDKAKSAGHTVGKAASKAKIPLVASGAALAGAAGGLAFASHQSHKGGIASALRRPKVKISSGDVAKVAKEVGSFSTQIGALAAELQRNREESGNGRRRSPIEVALQGLTSRD